MPAARVRVLAALLALLNTAPVLGAGAGSVDIYLLKDGDRISGRTVLKGKRLFGVLTAYGRLNIAREQVARVLWADGHEEVLAEVTPGHMALALGLVLVVTGRSFWHAWDPAEDQADTTLRLQISIDEAPVATYVDTRTDTEDLPGATVNSFHFASADVRVQTAQGVVATPPETRPGRITLRLRLPATQVGEHQLRVAYQVNLGTAAAPAWHDASVATAALALRYEAPTIIELAQDPGRMEFTRRHMRRVETFRITARPVLAQPAELDTPRPES